MGEFQEEVHDMITRKAWCAGTGSARRAEAQTMESCMRVHVQSLAMRLRSDIRGHSLHSDSETSQPQM
eukprot:CAMPEP_0206521728 /NCGR_PEP_ID=MMETSP0324_2-20121206/66526_1 /ASSEMBLY_ACC=CAM_ASM_000836 /TAXON_ID=2866 /ORGANISM="Crypthecodinium cohnii, Strain Seligo" /LENGTH=67 /DNA_ID=CAMNT_0054015689 /DNA_START=313 /DNA_END=516 /DNA_ORIENTATION=-